MTRPQVPQARYLGGESPQLVLAAQTQQPQYQFRGGKDVEGRRQSGALLEVAHPQLRAGKLPLRV